MKKVAKKLQQSLSILLSVAMIITCVPQTAFAAQNDVIDAETEADDVDVVDAVDTTDVDAETEASDIEGIIEEGGDEAEAAEDVDAVTEPEIETANVVAEDEGQDEEIVGAAAVEAEVEELGEAEVSYVAVGESEAFKAATGKYVLNVGDLAYTVGSDGKDNGLASALDAGTTKSGKGYFNLKSGMKITSSEKSFTIGTESVDFTKRLQTNGAGTTTSKNIEFITAAKATVTVCAVTGGANGTAYVKILDNSGSAVKITETEDSLLLDLKKDSEGNYIFTQGGKDDGKGSSVETVGTWTLETPGTYYIVGVKGTGVDGTKEDGSKLSGSGQNAIIYGVIVQEEAPELGENEIGITIDPVEATFNNEDNKPTSIVVKDSDDNKLNEVEADSEADGYIISYAKVGEDGTETATTEVKDAGAYKVIATGNGQYATADPAKADYTIKKLGLTSGTSGNTEVDTTDLTNLVVKTAHKDGAEKTVLTKGTDYDVKYEVDGVEKTADELADVQNATVVVTIKGIGNYDGTITANKTIGTPGFKSSLNVTDLTNGNITVADANGDNLDGSIFSVIPKGANDTATPPNPTNEVQVDHQSSSAKTFKYNIDNPDETPVVSGATGRLKLWGVGSKESRAVTFEVKEDSTLTICAMTSDGDVDVPLMLCEENGEPIKIADLPKSGNTVKAIKHNVAQGTYYLYAGPNEGKANNSGVVESKSVNFYYLSLGPKTEDTFEVTVDEATYNGQEQAPNVTVTVNGTPIEDYTVTVEGGKKCIDAGDYTLTVSGKEDYADKTETATFKIKPLDLTADNTKAINSGFDENKKPVAKVLVKVSEHFTVIPKDSYTVVYKNTTGAEIPDDTDFTTYEGDVTAEVTGKVNFSGTCSVPFSLVVPKAFDAECSESVVYNGKEQKPVVRVTYGSSEEDAITLVEGTDYKVDYSRSGADAAYVTTEDFTSVGEIKVEVTGLGQYAEDGVIATFWYNINKFTMTNDNIQVTTSKIVDNKLPVTVEAKFNGTTFETVPESDYDVKFFKEDGTTEITTFADFVAGKVLIKVTVKGSNIDGEASILKDLTADGYEAGAFVLDSIDNVVYNGEDQKPDVTVKYEGNELEANKDYEVKYERDGATGDALNDLKNVGTIKVTVTGKAGTEYADKTPVTDTFDILPYDLNNATITVGETIENKVVSVTVKADKDLVAGTDYNVVYKDKTGATVTEFAADYVGAVTIVITAKSDTNYTGTVTKNVTISNVKPTEYVVTFVVKGKSFTQNKEVGSLVDALPAEVTAAIGSDKFEGLYTDSAFTPKSKWNMSVNIVQADTTLYVRTSAKQGALYVPTIPDQVYTGADIKPAVVVYAADGTLLTAKDYKVIYTKGATTNANADPNGTLLKDDKGQLLTAPSFVIEGKGNYKEKITVTFNIRQVSIGSGKTFAPGFTAKVNDSLLANAKGVAPLTSLKYKKAMNIKATAKAPQDFEAAITKVGETKPLGSTDKKGYPTVTAEGVYTLEVKGVNNFAGTVTKTIMVGNKDNSLSKAKVAIGKNIKKPECNDLKKGTLKIEPGDGTATGFAVTMGKDTKLTTDDYTYEVVYSNGTTTTPAVGKAQLIITAKAPAATGRTQYYGSKSVVINVAGTAVKKAGLTVEKVTSGDNAFKASVDFTGKAIYQNNAVKVKVSDNNYLTPKKDYTISYKNNIKKGKATITFTMLPASGYTGKLTETFTINAVQMSTAKIYEGTADITSAKKLTAKVPYSKAGIKPSNRITLALANGYVLKEGTDYTVAYKNNKNAGGEGVMTVKGKGSLAGSVDVKFDIAKAKLSDTNVVVTSLPYKEKAKSYKIKLKVTDANGKALAAGPKKDYTITGDTCAGTDATTYIKAPDTAKRPEATLTGANNYEGSVKVYFSFFEKGNKLVKADVTVGEGTYKSGVVVKAPVTVKHGGKTLVNGKDYVLTWGKNNAAGKNKGSVTVVGQGIYGGSVTAKFTINARDINKADEDKFDKAFYDSYIDDNILENKRLEQIAEKVNGIKSITYDPASNKFTVTVDDTTVNMYDTFMALYNENKEDPRGELKYGLLKTTFNEDLVKADKIKVEATFPTPIGGRYTDSRERAVANYLDWTYDQLVNKAVEKMETGLERVAEYMGKDVETVKAYTLEKVVDKTIDFKVTMTYKAAEDKEDLKLDYKVEFVKAAAN